MRKSVQGWVAAVATCCAIGLFNISIASAQTTTVSGAGRGPGVEAPISIGSPEAVAGESAGGAAAGAPEAVLSEQAAREMPLVLPKTGGPSPVDLPYGLLAGLGASAAGLGMRARARRGA